MVITKAMQATFDKLVADEAKRKAQQRAFYARHKEAIKARVAKWRAANPKAAKAANERRNARRRAKRAAQGVK